MLHINLPLTVEERAKYETYEASLTPFERWMDGADLSDIDELIWAARALVKQWGDIIEGFQCDARVSRLSAALEPFSTAPGEKEETNVDSK